MVSNRICPHCLNIQMYLYTVYEHVRIGILYYLLCLHESRRAIPSVRGKQVKRVELGTVNSNSFERA